MESFQDFLPAMAEKLGGQGFITEICKGFQLLADPKTGLITVESLRKSSAMLGLDSMSETEIKAMIREGDLDGDGCLNQNEFCVLMIRTSPSFMNEAERWLHWALLQDDGIFDLTAPGKSKQ